MKWKFLKARQAFQQYQEMWDSLNAATHNHLLLDSKFWVPLVNVFGNERTYSQYLTGEKWNCFWGETQFQARGFKSDNLETYQ